ncbi:CvfB family protein [Lacticaseibacillus pantheris]|jgi:predicted RNA-binding protein (virulence factor B family)|uniref:RNA-binding protein, S1-like domain n=1 Tax=Lacticaseibacillus pantheris DSM 15945 = JCM 12539 = NBRC 106106 TaxID=1423783 RepID=A0A0R1U3M5_9LACO|nr:S1-like domain-containing RNA-binding protein [Lacticaseibacillus pantheris]KRL85525.1 RNA-binding protein, S1-like domain [Lacticaseibacillus pantheris DSM 15945 = JCM 12539 = NBRC 106106]WKF85463.1 S1-like domain-containing RNA-binding protein [Lacticaseibacillus pantheris]
MDFNGQTVTGKVTDSNEDYVYVQYAGTTMAVQRSEFDEMPALGSSVTGFAYENEHREPRMTTKQLAISESQYAFCPVVQVRRDLGVFVDVGLPDKDVVVSLDDLPLENRLWPSRGDRLMIRLELDNKHRMWGKVAAPDFFPQLAHIAHDDMKNKDVTATVYRLKLAGTLVFTDDHYLGFIHPSERDAEPRLGQVVHARVIGIRQDGGLNLSLHPRAYEAIDDDAAMLLAVMQHSHDGRLNLTDKSDPALIRQHLDISKGAFKRALGHLLKARLVREMDGYVELLPQDKAPDAE